MSFLHNYLSRNSLKKNLELQLLLRMEMERESKYLTITDVQLNPNISGTKNDKKILPKAPENLMFTIYL